MIYRYTDEDGQPATGKLFYLDENLLLHTPDPAADNNMYTGGFTIGEILRGELTIRKRPAELSNSEKYVVGYAKACGYRYIAKNPDGTIVVYESEPTRSSEQDHWSAQGMTLLIQTPCTFLSGFELNPTALEELGD